MPASRASLTIGTTRSASLLLPPQAVPAPLPWGQVPIGVSGHMTANLDPFAAYDDGTIQSFSFAFLGHSGHGKSSAIKTFLERMLILPEELEDGTTRLRRAVIIDRKGEYRALAQLFTAEPVVVGHGISLNPFDDRLDPQQQRALLHTYLELLKGRPLEPVERRIATVAYHQARAQRHEVGSFLLADVRDALADLSPESLTRLDPLPHDEVKRTAILLAFALDDLLDDGHLTGLFDQPTTPALDWSKQVIVISVHPDYTVTRRELVYQLLVAIIAVWLDQAWQSPDPHRRVDFFNVDEAWDYVKVPQFAGLLQDKTKLGRSMRLCVLLSFQGASDTRSAGDVGQVQREMAQRLLEEVAGYFLFNQSPADAELLRGVAQLTDDDIDIVSHLPAHTFMLILGSGDKRRRLVAAHRITADEVELVDSDAR